ncbi:MAG: DUF11 domain-containing protein, partial [Gammaproteobacteria bacterium]|nr:DUF11 domain-containing protein [Gammaproteobacteria bacterium]
MIRQFFFILFFSWLLFGLPGIQEAQASVILEEYTSGQDDEWEIKSDQNYGQTFSHDSGGGTYDVDQVSVYMRRDSDAASQTIRVQIRSGSWNGTVECSNSFASNTLGTSYGFKDVSLSGCPSLTDSTTYWIRVTSSTSDGKVWLGSDSGSATYSNGDFIDKDGNPYSGEDALFRVWGTVPTDLALTKTVDDPTPTEADTIIYTVVLDNNGPGATTNVTVTDLLPGGVTYVTDVPTKGTYVDGTGVWTVGGMANGGSETLTITATVDAGTAPSTIVNTASVSASDVTDPTPGNDSDTANITVQTADLTLIKTDGPDPAPTDGPLVYTLLVT